jgi:hypothetical protein
MLEAGSSETSTALHCIERKYQPEIEPRYITAHENI